jgi:hypothetical protein
MVTRWLIFAVLTIVVVECVAAAICWTVLPRSPASKFIWNPDLEQARNNWNALSSVTDEEIGGVRPPGAKSNSEFPDQVKACGSAYGDSYVGGADVADSEGWVEQLSHLLNCRVTNYAVGGYGTDQAYLRFRQVYDESPLVLLGINPNNIQDNINQYDGFLGSALTPNNLKGRFLLDTFGHLQWVAQPHFDATSFAAMHRNPTEALPHSYFLPDTPDGPVTVRFPYAVTLARIALIPRLHSILARRTEWSSLYSRDHPSGSLQLMIAICEGFAELAKARDKRPLVVMLPLAHSFREQANYGTFEYAPLVAELEAKGIPVFDPGTAMLEALAGRSVCEYFGNPHEEMAWLTTPVPCGGHYSVSGNTTMARLVGAELRRRDLVKQ